MKSIVDFETDLRALPDPINAIRDGMIGKDVMIPTPTGPRPMIYADYIASGRALAQVETFVMQEVLPYYANTHTEDSFCGARTNGLREDARRVIAQKCGANPTDHAVIFTGSGATSGLNQLVHLFGLDADIAAGTPVTVLVGPYEHHSNILPWREAGARVIEIDELPEGGADPLDLSMKLAAQCPKGPVVVALSAASNVTGIQSDIALLSRLARQHGARMVWDFAGGAPYMAIDMIPEIDAIALSPHKFTGGPGASGVLLVRRDAVRAQTPTRPGGGTVAFVNGARHDYVAPIEQREEGGTPNIIGDIRAALAFVIKDVIGQEWIDQRNAALAAKAFARLKNHPEISILAPDHQNRLPFLSFVPRVDGQRMDHGAFTRALSQNYAIQARGGCSCAGPYVHRLLAIDDAQSLQIRADILRGDCSSKPGFVRLNLSFLMQDATVDYILDAICELARAEVRVA